MNKLLQCGISESIWFELQAEMARTDSSLSQVVQKALSEALGLDHHSVFQVSTSGAIVHGVFKGCATVADLKHHGDFGLGTFEDLDGEMVILGGHCYRAGIDGDIREAEDNAPVPFATVTRFVADKSFEIGRVESLDELSVALDKVRNSPNAFVGLRLDGRFERIDLRAACRALPGEDLVTATGHQSEFSFKDISGTLVGFWTPAYAKTLGIAGYHIHFLSDDRTVGGHLIDLAAGSLRVGLHVETDLHVAIPETEGFLRADLQDDPSAALDVAERNFVRDR